MLNHYPRALVSILLFPKGEFKGRKKKEKVDFNNPALMTHATCAPNSGYCIFCV